MCFYRTIGVFTGCRSAGVHSVSGAGVLKIRAFQKGAAYRTEGVLFYGSIEMRLFGEYVLLSYTEWCTLCALKNKGFCKKCALTGWKADRCAFTG